MSMDKCHLFLESVISHSTLRLVIFGGTNFVKQAKFQVSEIFLVGETGIRRLASNIPKS